MFRGGEQLRIFKWILQYLHHKSFRKFKKTSKVNNQSLNLIWKIYSLKAFNYVKTIFGYKKTLKSFLYFYHFLIWNLFFLIFLILWQCLKFFFSNLTWNLMAMWFSIKAVWYKYSIWQKLKYYSMICFISCNSV